MNFSSFKLPPTNTQQNRTPRHSPNNNKQWNISDAPPTIIGSNKKRPLPSSPEDSSPSTRMSEFRFVLPPNASQPQSRTTFQRKLQEDIQDEGGKVEFDGNNRLSASSFWQPTTPTPTSNKLPLRPFISTHPGTKATPETPTAPTTSFSVAPSYSSLDTPSFLSPAQFILPSTQPQSPDIAVASLSQWACSIKLPPPSPTSWTTADRVKEGASNEDRNAYKAGGGKGALYINGGYAERLTSLLRRERSDHTVWAHGVRRQTKNQLSMTQPSTPTSSFIVYKILSKHIDHGTIYTLCISSEHDGTDRHRTIIFSPIYSTHDEAEVDKILMGKLVRIWRPWVEFKGAEEGGEGRMMVVTRFRVVEGEEVELV